MTILSEAFLNWEPFEDVKHVKPSNLCLRDISKFGDNNKSIIKGKKRSKSEYMHPSTPLPKQQQAVPLCVCMQT